MPGKYSLSASTSIVIANMIGTGVFTSLGFQLLGIHDFASIVLLWLIGGVIALCGAFAYSELGAAMPQSGGEYNYLSQIFHPSIGFLSGWVSSTIGFAAPIAAAAWALGFYVNHVFPTVDPKLVGAGVILLTTLIHSQSHKLGGGFQVVFTSIKISLIVVFIVCGFVLIKGAGGSFMPTAQTMPKIFSSDFATSLVYVAFAYSGWNASAYVAGEVDNPRRNIPLSILIGTVVVAALYVLLNMAFLHAAPVNEMQGVKDVAFIPAKYIFGLEISKFINMVISVLLISTISSMVIAGPRVIHSIAQNFAFFKFFDKVNKHGVPVLAIWVQSFIALLILLVFDFETIVNYTTFVLTLFSTITVLGVIVYRYKKPGLDRPYKTWGYPVTPIIYLLINIWFLIEIIRLKTFESLIGLEIVAVGLIVYFATRLFDNKKTVHVP